MYFILTCLLPGVITGTLVVKTLKRYEKMDDTYGKLSVPVYVVFMCISVIAFVLLYI